MTATKSALQLLCAALILIAPALHAQNDASTATAKRLMVSSGLAVQLRGFADQIVDDIRRNTANVDQSTVERLAEAARQAFRPEALEQDITARVAKKLTIGDMNAALAWLDAETGARITRAEEAASGAMDAARLAQYAQRLQTEPLPPQRQKLVSDVISATGAVRVATSVAENMALGIALGMDSLQPQERRVGEARIRAHMRQAMAADKLQALFAQQLPVSYAYTYREIGEADLAAYVKFLRGATGKRYQDAMNAAFMEAIAQASTQFGDFTSARPRRAAL